MRAAGYSSDDGLTAGRAGEQGTARKAFRIGLAALVSLMLGACLLSFSGCSNASDEIVVKKPVIYLYPTKATDVSVKLSNPQNITAQYPEYGDGWNVTAQPNGDLTDTKTGQKLYSLYYESKSANPAKVEADGFVVKGSDTSKFLTDTLPKLGLNPHESEEFIIYWLPILQQNRYNYIRFESLNEINANQKLDITPKPDSLIRVTMAYKPLDQPISVTPEKIVTPERKGFLAVEWGGTEID